MRAVRPDFVTVMIAAAFKSPAIVHVAWEIALVTSGLLMVLRLNTLTLGYSLPDKVLHKAGLSKLRIYGTIYNLFTLTGYSGLDPEVSANTSQNKAKYPTVGLDWGTYPRARSFVVGLNLAF